MKEKEANKIYNKILKEEIIPLVGNKTTYMKDLDRVGRRLFGIKFMGVYPSDKIPILNSLKKYAILNLDKSTEPGSHWVSICYNPSTHETMLYDSFGRSHSKIIPQIQGMGNGRVINTDLDSEQKILETNCGARSLGWIKMYDSYGPEIAKLI